MSCSSASVGFWPKERITVPSSLVVMVPSPSLSKREGLLELRNLFLGELVGAIPFFEEDALLHGLHRLHHLHRHHCLQLRLRLLRTVILGAHIGGGA